jgi:hypothetical protein
VWMVAVPKVRAAQTCVTEKNRGIRVRATAMHCTGVASVQGLTEWKKRS